MTEKPSVAISYAKILGVHGRQDGYLEGNGYLVSWCVGHLVELAPPSAYGEQYVKWNIADLPILPEKWQYLVSASTKKQFGMQKIEVIVRITKGHCPPQEQTIFEWIEMNRAAPDTLNYPGLEINLEHRRVFKNGQEVYMSRYEYGVLSLMARHPGQLFTKEQIFEAVWHQDSESCLTAVTNTIGRIRQKIEDDRAVPVYIRTISNLGYQFMPNISVKKDSL